MKSGLKSTAVVECDRSAGYSRYRILKGSRVIDENRSPTVLALWLTLSARRGYHAAVMAKRSLNRSQIRCRHEKLMTLYCPECETTYEGDEYELCPADGSRLFQLSALQKKGDPLLGKIIDDRFRVEKLLGAGGMGAVYRGVQLSVQREVAIKVLRPDLADKEEFLSRFFREAKVVSELTHPNVVRLFEFGQDRERDLLYLVMELVRGVGLDELILRGRLESALALEIAYQICGALTEPHARGIIHRDLKPENLVILPVSDGTIQVKVLDFGIAQAVEEGTKITKTGMMCGTPSYMSPERAQDVEADSRADLYALGIILFEMLTGQLPFDGESSLKILFNHMFERPPNLAAAMPDGLIDEELSELVEDLLKKAPQERPQSARAVRDRVDEIRKTLAMDPVRLGAQDDDDAFGDWILPLVPLKDPEASKSAGDSDETLNQWEMATRKVDSVADESKTRGTMVIDRGEMKSLVTTRTTAPEMGSESEKAPVVATPEEKRRDWRIPAVVGAMLLLLLLSCAGGVTILALTVGPFGEEETTGEEAIATAPSEEREDDSATGGDGDEDEDAEEVEKVEEVEEVAESQPAGQKRPQRREKQTSESEPSPLQDAVEKEVREVFEDLVRPQPGRGKRKKNRR